jgi:hypothetical protein
MIQLATEPTASRTSHRPAANDAKGSDRESQRGGNGHAWPFLSRHATRPSQQEGRKDGANDSGS